MNGRVYLDHAATTPVLPAARAAMADAMERWANPSSPHADGRAARAALEDARSRIKAALGWDHDLLFVSGATEAAAIAFRQVKVGSHAVSAVEHDAIRRAATHAAIIPVDGAGVVKLDQLPDAALVAIQTVNSETGIIQPLDAVREAVGAKHGLWLADAAQSAGKLPLPPADMIIVSAHKLGGPPGIGALLIRNLGILAPSGGQEKGYRGGTENVPAIAAFAAALEARGSREHLASLREHIDNAVIQAGGQVIGAQAPRLPEIASYRLPGLPAAAQLIALDMAGIAVSAGSACSSGTLKASPVLMAMGWEEGEAREVIRVSIAPETSLADVDRFIAVWTSLADRRGTQ